MSILALFLAIMIIGLVVWFVNTYWPMPAQFQSLLIVVGIIVCVLLVLRAIGVWGALVGMTVPSIR